MERLNDKVLNEAIKAYNEFIEQADKPGNEDAYNPILDRITVILLEELREYRKTGLTPKQIFKMDEEYTRLAKKRGDVKKLVEGGFK